MGNVARGTGARWWLRTASIIWAFAFAATCSDQTPVTPGNRLLPGHSRLSVAPQFQPSLPGAPQVLLSKVRGILIGTNGDSIVVEALFKGDSAVLVFDVQFSGSSASYILDLTGFDANGVEAYHARQPYTLKAGENNNLPNPVLVYSAPDSKVERITVAPKTLTLDANASSGLAVTGTGANNSPITTLRVGWTSNNATVATVDENGAVHAGLIQGSTYIVATTVTGVRDSALVKVHAPVAKVNVAPATLQLVRGTAGAAAAELRDAANNLIDDRTASWTSSDPTVATVNASGAIQAVKIGTATITASAEGKSGTVAVTVVSPIDHIEITPATLAFASLHETKTLAVRLVPRTGASVAGLTPTITSSNSAVASVTTDGVVTANQNGSATITASADGLDATAAVTVRQTAASVAVSPKTATAQALGTTRSFTATVLDALGNEMPGGSVTWSSSNTQVATVVGGVATARGSGTATITASVDGKSDDATFTVSQIPRFLYASSDKASLQVGQSTTLRAYTADANGAIIGPVTATWTTSTPTIISLAGNVATATGPGTALITATVGSLTANVGIVVGGGSSLTVTPATVEKLPGGTQQFTVSGAAGPFTWRVNGIDGGNSTYGTITSDGYYTAPLSVPSPSTFDVCATAGGATGCSHVTINPIPTSGADVIVFNDINMFDNNYGSPYPNNLKLFENLITFTGTGARTTQKGVMFHRGHSSRCGLTECRPSDFSSMTNRMISLGYTITDVNDQAATITAIPSEIKVIFLMMPMTPYSNAELNVLKTFAATGGRIIFVGEREPYYGTTTGIPVENAFFQSMGALMRNVGGDYACIYQMGASNIKPHQVTTGLTGLSMACASAVQLGPNDYALVTDLYDQNVVLAAVAKIDLTLLPVQPTMQALRIPSRAGATTIANDPAEHSWGRGSMPTLRTAPPANRKPKD